MSAGPNNDPVPYQGWTKAVLRNLAATVTDVSEAGVAGNPVAVGLIAIENTSGATAFVQIFDSAAASVTLNTTHPDLEIPVAATTGFQVVSFPTGGGRFASGLSFASTTASEGSSGSAAGVRVTVFYR